MCSRICECVDILYLRIFITGFVRFVIGRLGRLEEYRPPHTQFILDPQSVSLTTDRNLTVCGSLMCVLKGTVVEMREVD